MHLAQTWAAQRQTFGKPLIERQVIRHKLAEMARQTAVAKTYLRDVTARWLDGQDVTAEIAMVKNTAVFCCDHVVDEAVQMHGGMGYMRESEIERHYRDARHPRHRWRDHRDHERDHREARAAQPPQLIPESNSLPASRQPLPRSEFTKS